MPTPAEVGFQIANVLREALATAGVEATMDEYITGFIGYFGALIQANEPPERQQLAAGRAICALAHLFDMELLPVTDVPEDASQN
jgi:hypothetical protein